MKSAVTHNNLEKKFLNKFNSQIEKESVSETRTIINKHKCISSYEIQLNTVASI